MTLKAVDILAIDADRIRQGKLSVGFTQPGMSYTSVAESGRALEALRTKQPNLILVFGELASDFIGSMLDALVTNEAGATLPIVVVANDVSQANLVQNFRVGVVGIVSATNSVSDLVAEVLGLADELSSRNGIHAGAGDGGALSQVLACAQLTRRSGLLVVAPRTPKEARVTFTCGEVMTAEMPGVTREAALSALAALGPTRWTFTEHDGTESRSTTVIEVGTFGQEDFDSGAVDFTFDDSGATPVRAPNRRPAAANAPPPTHQGRTESPRPQAANSTAGAVPAKAQFTSPPPLQKANLGSTSPAPAKVGPNSPIPTAGPPRPATVTTPVPKERARLLLVDDNDAILMMFSTLFEKHAFAVTTARDGKEGAARAFETEFDLIFADLNMPHLDGWGMLRLLRSDFRTREIPIAFISAHDDYREALKALDAGAQAYVPKGTKLELVIAQARAVLEPRRALAEKLQAKSGTVPVTVHVVGPQWTLRRLAALNATCTLTAGDGWANYTLQFVNGDCVAAGAVAGKYTAQAERAFNAFIATRNAAGDVVFPGPAAPAKSEFEASVSELLQRARETLNENETRASDTLMVQATEVEVNAALYDVYRQVGPKQWLECARLICDERLAPREIISRLQFSPIDIEETMRDLVRRGVVTLKRVSPAPRSPSPAK